MFYQNFKRLCDEKGTTMTKIVESLGISSSKVTAIKKGSLPKEAMIKDFAKALDCDVMDFFVDTERPTYQLDEDEVEVIKYYRNLDKVKQHEFMYHFYKMLRNEK